MTSTTYGPIAQHPTDWRRFEDPTRNLATYAVNRPPTVLRSANAVETAVLYVDPRPVSPAFAPGGAVFPPGPVFAPGYAAAGPAVTMTDLPAPAPAPEPKRPWRYRSEHRAQMPAWVGAVFGASVALPIGGAIAVAILWWAATR